MTAGRPPKFNSPGELQSKVDEFFKWIEGEFHYEIITPKEGKPFKQKIYDRDPEYPSVTGLSFFLGFESRQSFYDYEKDGDFSYTIKRARLRIEAFYEQGLNRQASSGAIFALKNFGWQDKQQFEHSLPENQVFEIGGRKIEF